MYARTFCFIYYSSYVFFKFTSNFRTPTECEDICKQLCMNVVEMFEWNKELLLVVVKKGMNMNKRKPKTYVSMMWKEELMQFKQNINFTRSLSSVLFVFKLSVTSIKHTEFLELTASRGFVCIHIHFIFIFIFVSVFVFKTNFWTSLAKAKPRLWTKTGRFVNCRY